MHADDPHSSDPAERLRRALRLTSAPPPALVDRLAAVAGPDRPGLAPPELARRLDEVAFAVLDFETTGWMPGAAEILEVSVYEVRGGRVRESFHSLVRPRGPIPPGITALTGIDAETVRDAPAVDAVLEPLLERLRGRVLVAHNAPFDLRFLDQALRAHRLGAWEGPVVCTRRLARRLRPDLGRFGLDDLCAAYDIPNRARHRARGDAEATAHLLVELLRLCAGMGVRTLGDLLVTLRRRPSPAVDFDRYAFGPALLQHLPRAPGIYRMLDRDGAVLYVGKARDLRERVGSYFTGRARGRVAALREALHDLEVVPTGSEIEAILREAAEIRALRPPFNVQVNVRRRGFWLKLSRRGGRTRIVCAPRAAGAGVHGPFFDARGGRETARLLRFAAEVVAAAGATPDLEDLIARGRGIERWMDPLRAALEAHVARGDDRGAEEVRRAMRAVRGVAAVAAGARSGPHRRDLVVRLPGTGACRLFLLCDGAPLAPIEVGPTVDETARRIEALLRAPHPPAAEGQSDALALLDHWLARGGASAVLDLGDLADPGALRRGLSALLAAPPPQDARDLIR